jgi:hypothetical protein
MFSPAGWADARASPSRHRPDALHPRDPTSTPVARIGGSPALNSQAWRALLNVAKSQPSLLLIDPPPASKTPGPAAMTSPVKALFALATVAAVSIGLMLPVPGARQSLDARGHYDLMDVGR